MQIRPADVLANQYSDARAKTANIFKIFLETLRETRTIKIKGKNVDDLDLEKLGSFIQQANRKTSRVDLIGLFKSLKEQLP